MNTEQLVLDIRKRAASEDTRTDIRGEMPQKLFGVVDTTVISETQRQLGFELPKLLTILYVKVGNGGFGPGYGLFGLRGGHADADGRTIVDIYPDVQEAVAWHLKVSGRKFLPICDWGSSILSCLDCESADVSVLTLDEHGFTRTRFTLESWFDFWLTGRSIWYEMYEFGEIEGINPFTKKPMTLRTRAAPKGERILS